MISQEELKAIFIEEATEIVEKLDVDIIRFEENSSDFELLNEIFRGVHTLKGNSNAFGFTRLGEFVHHFEDLLDYYRSTKERIEANNLELFVESVDVVKEVMGCELNSIKELPQSYTLCLEKIKKLLDVKKNKIPTSTPQESPEVLSDLALEFDELPLFPDEDATKQSIKIHQAMQSGALNLYKITLTLDEDCYRRGFDHFIFLKILGEHSKSLESFFSMKNIQTIESFQSTQNSIDKVDIVALTSLVYTDVEEIFEFLFDHEYKIIPIQAPPPPPQKEIEKEVQKEAETVCKSAVNNNTETVSSTNANAPKSTIRIDTYKVDELFDSVGELVIAQNFIAQNREIRSIENETINRTIEVLSKITKKIQDRVMSLRMVAIKDTFEKMKRVVRDTSKKTGKEIHLIIQGEETEIDKTMIDSLSDPLIHIIRNAIDHGLESCTDERVSVGKSAEGTLTLRAFHKSGNIVISVSDDGRGIDKERVFQKAVERGVIGENENLSDAQIFALIMQPGFSTAQTISDLSGRGVGLDVVKTSIEKLRGKIEIESKKGEGTTFSLMLPLTLAIIDGMLVQVGEEIYIIPTLCVVESFRPEKEIVHAAKGKGEFVTLRKECIPIVRLSDVFNLDTAKSEPWESILVCVETEGGRIAVMIDELLGRQQVVIKTLGKSLSRVKEISGGAILGNGDIALILNVDALRPLGGS